MLFNSLDFAVFLPIVFFLYWFITNRNLSFQNLLIVISSYIFYSFWDWRFLSLIIFSTLTDYIIGLALGKEKSPKKRKILLWASMLINLGFLGVFKYYNFFIENFKSAFLFFGQEINISTLHIILPVGISFYTFQTMSYTIDVYRKQFEPTKDFVAFSAFVSFFPQLAAGPIERATNFLPQFYKKRTFDYTKAIDGLKQTLWGLFKKVVIADNCAEFANEIFNNSAQYSGSTLALGAIFFAFQIYGDFSGYSDMAIGISRLFGFDLKRNFAFPYFSRDIAEFWRRWHISLSTWFRDYLYIPLGGSKGGMWMKIRNTFIIFIVSGFWHGANWTFIAWGIINVLYFLPLLLTNKNRTHLEIIGQRKYFPTLREFTSMGATFGLTTLAWVFFRAENITHAFDILKEIFSVSLFNKFEVFPLKIIALIFIFTSIEWMGRESEYALEKIGLKWKTQYRYLMYYVIILSILVFGAKEQEFIYFQF